RTRSTVEQPGYSYLDSVTLSRLHARVGIDCKGTYVIDIGVDGRGSTNGTFVNGVRLEPNRKYYLSSTDELWMGKSGSAPGHQVIVQFLP
ncbi:MAG TPA: FHA domain-containing protein, partial [Chroococcales cyanobacterium]